MYNGRSRAGRLAEQWTATRRVISAAPISAAQIRAGPVSAVPVSAATVRERTLEYGARLYAMKPTAVVRSRTVAALIDASRLWML